MNQRARSVASGLVQFLALEVIISYLQLILAEETCPHDRYEVMIAQLLCCLLIQTFEVSWHHLKMRFESDLLMEPLRFSLDYWLVVTVDVEETVLLSDPDLVAGALQP